MKNLYVTSPLLPDLDEFKGMLDEIWESKYVTNCGSFHARFEAMLAEFLGVEYVSIFTNGTLPLIVAMKALGISGEVITTPYSFVATSNILMLLGLKPVFVDVDEYGNIDPDRIEDAITDRTSAILAVHVYGNPCRVDSLREVADRNNLRLVYDAAHAFGVKRNGRSILLEGDMSSLSFHATKVFNTLEGGALICHSSEMKKRIDCFRNFGIEDETTVTEFGINCKMDEVRCAYGIANLGKVGDAIADRRRIAEFYRDGLRGVDGISFFDDIDGVDHNYSYFPIFVGGNYGMSRDCVCERMKAEGIFARKYFYPLIPDFKAYNGIEAKDFPNARRLSESVLCLPLFAGMTIDEARRVVESIK